MSSPQTFQWTQHPKAEAFIQELIDVAKATNPYIANLEQELLKSTSTRFFDWVDHVTIGHSTSIEKELVQLGFSIDQAAPDYRAFHHFGAQLPSVVVKDQPATFMGISVAVESIADFLMVRGLRAHIEGTPLSPYRRCCVETEKDVSLWVVERRGARTFEPTTKESDYPLKYILGKEMWMTRPRHMPDEDQSMQYTLKLAEKLVVELGQDAAAWIVLECERAYWQARNTAGQLQKNRQDKQGMGWANHDHHTFRSSRRHFAELVRLFEILGFKCRERFYAGEEAGWGAQVMENSRCRLVLFLDLDLSPDEIQEDFAHQLLPDLPKLGTVGLWCALHGDSILHSGMHHLEAQFMFEQLTAEFKHLGVGMMDPFSNFPYLKQAFTEGEVWRVDPKRVEHVLEKGKVTKEEGEKFLKYGAVGSHLENLQRREGYKGFNQKNVSSIIRKTDPRNY